MPTLPTFIFEPTEVSPLHDPANPVFPKYTFRVVEAFLRPLEAQRHILGAVLHELEAINPVAGDIQNLVKLFSRFNDFLGSLNSVLPGFEFVVRNEADLQRALTPALRLFARDVRPEDFVPDFGGSRSRTDFFLPDSGIAIETKMTRESLRAGKLRDELIIDFRQYASLGRVQGIVAFVYDPDRRLDNPAALDDLSDLSLDKPTYVYVLSGR